MDLELAQKLKDAGYPISLMSKGCENCWADLGKGCSNDCQTIELPTLADIIEKLGGSFRSIERFSFGWSAIGLGKQRVIYAEGVTVYECLVNLWVLLRKE